MKLDLSGTELTQPLTDDLIVKSLESLGANDDSFLILSEADQKQRLKHCVTVS